MNQSVWDLRFDIMSDRQGGQDADRHSPTLREQHRLLWTKPLPTGPSFDLVDVYPNGYLKYDSESGETFSLSSDASIRTFARVGRMSQVVASITPEELKEFRREGTTVAGCMLFPGNRIGRRQTINQARGMHPRIADRLDLTLECIRLHYLTQSNPLEKVLNRYSSFFDLFDNFDGYVDFWLLQDLVEGGAVRFFTNWKGFNSGSAFPSAEEYPEYRRRTLDFVRSRRSRMQNHMKRLKDAQ